MRRREFVTLLGGAAAAAWPIATAAQEASKLPTIGFLGASTPSTASQWVTAFLQRLHELGWTEGRNVAIEFRGAEGRTDRFVAIATEFARLKVDVMVAYGQPAVVAAKQAAPGTPMVFTLVGDPVGTGLVANLARPGGNVTGLSTQYPDIGGKRLELLREAVPSLRRLAIMGNAGEPSIAAEMGELNATAHALGLEAAIAEIHRAGDIAPAFDALKGRVDALYVRADPLLLSNLVRINTLALAARLPTMHGSREYVQAGGLMSYGPNFLDLFRRTAEYVDKILRGAKPADIPVEQPTRFEVVINLTTARALGIDIPPTLLARADEVIE
jgi:putative ABC transport system substrate-binding protein